MPDKSTNEPIPPGFTLRRTLRGHTRAILRITWAPDGRTLASTSVDMTIRLWNTETGVQIRKLEGHSQGVNQVAWSPEGRSFASASFDRTIQIWDAATGNSLWRIDNPHSGDIPSVSWAPNGQILASCSEDKTIKLWNTSSWELQRKLEGHTDNIYYVAWSPDGRKLASCSNDMTIRIWNPVSGALQMTLRGHTQGIIGIVWSPDSRMLASASFDHTVRIWDTELGQQRHILTDHTDIVRSTSFSSDAKLLASNTWDGLVRLWRCDTWEMINIFNEVPGGFWPVSIAFHPKKSNILATLGDEDKVIHIWNLDIPILLRTAPTIPIVHYTNAKVVLVGDSGVGKSGLCLVLTDQPFVPTESTHGRHVWTFENQEVERDGKVREIRETLLWDLAGQPGYRLIHQLHLNEVAAALVVFDSRSETDPFAGVHYWDRALRLAGRANGNAALPVKKFLVAARTDRGGRSVSRARIEALVQELGFAGYFETSAKAGRNIAELIKAIREAIDWEALPRATSTDLFQRIKTFFLTEQQAGRLLSTRDELYLAFLKAEKTFDAPGDLRTQFDTCLRLAESSGLIRSLSFGNFVLLQPELLDAYASALLNAVKDEPDGLGSIAEERVRQGQFPIPQEERLKNQTQEKLLLIEMIEELLRHEITLLEQGHLIFPSQSTRENPDLPAPEGKAVIFRFEGPMLSVYTTLAVRLSHSGLFKKKELWKNAVTYTTYTGGMYGIFLHMLSEERGELTLFFDKTASEETCFHFEEYIREHLQRHALPESISRRRIFVCPECGGHSPMRR